MTTSIRTHTPTNAQVVVVEREIAFGLIWDAPEGFAFGSSWDAPEGIGSSWDAPKGIAFESSWDAPDGIVAFVST
jgi:hypothetical protein